MFVVERSEEIVRPTGEQRITSVVWQRWVRFRIERILQYGGSDFGAAIVTTDDDEALLLLW
jgi:hypothetical protein